MKNQKNCFITGGNSNHWIVIKPKGTTNNTAGIGARVRVVVGSLSQIRYIEAGGAGGIQNGFSWAHFGLGTATTADSVIVKWPTGAVDVATNVAADKYYAFEQGTGIISSINKPGKNAIPSDFTLDQNYPNPFNPSTTIQLFLPVRSDIRLTLVNIMGGVVTELANGNYEAGNHQVRFDASNLSTGVYFYKLEAGGFVNVKKLVLMK